MDYNYLFYIFLSFVLTTGGSYVLLMSGRTISAMIYFVGLLTLEILFGLRWFKPSGATTNAEFGPWPPAINVCPDFLSLYKIGGNSVCVDTIGVSSGGLSVWTGPTQMDDRFVFNLFTDSTGADRTKKLCDQARTKMVTWEGVWDGTTCLGGQPPLPPA
jgi:hypothetical protein